MLSNKFYALTKKYQKSGLINSRYGKRKAESDSNSDDDLDYEIDDQDPDYIWLKMNSSPNDLVITKWKSTFDLRRKHLEKKALNMFQFWPILMQPIAVDLVIL